MGPSRSRTTPSTPARTGLVLLLMLATAGCSTMNVREDEPLVPNRHQTSLGPFRVHTQRALAVDDPLLVHLAALERDVSATLGLKLPRGDGGDPPIEVYILEDRERFEHFLRIYNPGLPPRRAFFVAVPPRRAVYAYFHPDLAEDLRHEATHALLNASVGDVPLWLDEGLAEYFEGGPAAHGRNAQHLDRMPADLAAGWSPDLKRLESLATVRDLSARDYRESWLWVHYLLHAAPAGRSALLAYLADPGGPPLSARLERLGGDPAERLLAHLDRAREDPLAFAAPPRPASTSTAFKPVIRAQSEELETVLTAAPAAPAARRPGPFTRFLHLFGIGREPEAPRRPRRPRTD